MPDGETRNLGGRPSSYTPELAGEICKRIGQGRSLRSVCRDDDMPDMSTIWRWMSSVDGFRNQYELACADRAEAHAEELLEIADDGNNDYMEKLGPDGQSIGWQLNGEHVQRSKLRVDARKWLMARMLPKKYGEKQQVEHSGEITLGLSDRLEQARARIAGKVVDVTPTPKALEDGTGEKDVEK